MHMQLQLAVQLDMIVITYTNQEVSLCLQGARWGQPTNHKITIS